MARADYTDHKAMLENMSKPEMAAYMDGFKQGSQSDMPCDDAMAMCRKKMGGMDAGMEAAFRYGHGLGMKDKKMTNDVTKREFTPQQRETSAEHGHAMPDGSYPIENKSDLLNAIQAFGRAKDKGAVKAHIKRRAKELGAEDALPMAWTGMKP